MTAIIETVAVTWIAGVVAFGRPNEIIMKTDMPPVPSTRIELDIDTPQPTPEVEIDYE